MQVLRLGLTVYLMLATVAGPAFCCCLPGHFAALWTAASAKHSESQRTCSCPACCHEQAPSEPSRQDVALPSRGQSNHPNDSQCPCKSAGAQAYAVVSINSVAAKQLQQLGGSERAADLVGSLGTVASGPTIQGIALGCDCLIAPFQTPRDMLRALHILRC